MRTRSIALLLALLLVLAAPAAALAASLAVPVEATPDQAASLVNAKVKAIAYLKAAQREDGGFGGGDAAAWVILGLALAGEDLTGPTWSKGSYNPVRSLEKDMGTLQMTIDYSRLLLAVGAAGRDGKSFANLDIIARILVEQNDRGHIGREMEENRVDTHTWSIIALPLAGWGVPKQIEARDWLFKVQNEDGGWGMSVNSSSNPEDTAAAILALRILGVLPGEEPLQRALAFLAKTQLSDGGFGWSDAANAEAGALVGMALAALGQNPLAGDWNKKGKGLLGHLLSLQAEDGSFAGRPGTYTRPEASTGKVLMALASVLPVLPANAFGDVPAAHFAAAAVRGLMERGVIGGYPDGTFRPQNPVTRAEFAKMLVSALGRQAEASQVTEQFGDLKKEHWANKFVRVALDRGLMRGKGQGVFDPEGRITGAEVMAVLARARGLADPSSEKQGPYWYSAYVAAAEKSGWLYPDFDPARAATRAEVAVSLWASLK